MSWYVTVSGHEDDGPNPPEPDQVRAVAVAAVKAAAEQGLHVRSVTGSPGADQSVLDEATDGD